MWVVKKSLMMKGAVMSWGKGTKEEVRSSCAS
jgi:hypothetical protein